MSDGMNVNGLSFLKNLSGVYSTNTDNTYSTTDTMRAARRASSEDELVEYDESPDSTSEVDALQAKRDRELQKYFMYQDKLVSLQKKQAKYEQKLEQFKDKPQRAQRYQAKLDRITGEIGEYTQKCNTAEANMNNLSAQIEQEIEKALTQDTQPKTANAMNLSYTGGAQSASPQIVNLSASPVDTTFLGGYKGTSIAPNVAAGLDAKLGSGFSNKCENVANYLGCNVNDLLAMMYSESGINPQAGNPNGGAIGLIQFMPSVLSGNGYSTAQVKNMNGLQQLDLVAEMLMKSKKMAGYGQNEKIDAGTLYGLCFLPAVAKSEVLCSTSGKLAWAYNANKGLDMDHDGSITKTDLAKRLSKKYNEMASVFGNMRTV